MKIFYRISENSYKKERLVNATKQKCLENFLNEFGTDDVTLYPDRVSDHTMKWLETTGCSITPIYAGSSAQSFRRVLFDAVLLDNNEQVLFQEDDYLHLPGAKQVLLEGLSMSHYVTLYLHGDRFIPASMGGNPYVDDSASFITRFFKTDSSFWVQVDSTTMTFATTVETLKNDQHVWLKYTEGDYPHDFQIFQELSAIDRTLIAPVPTKSTHCDVAWVAPLIGTNYSTWTDI